jgi:hypothetical protein
MKKQITLIEFVIFAAVYIIIAILVLCAVSYTLPN